MTDVADPTEPEEVHPHDICEDRGEWRRFEDVEPKSENNA